MKKPKIKKHAAEPHHKKPAHEPATAPAKATDLDSVMHPKFEKAIATDPMQKRKVGSDEQRLAWLER
jgi:hypothetical protein